VLELRTGTVWDQRCTNFLGKGPQCIIFSALESRKQNYELNCRESSTKIPTSFYLTSSLIACGLVLLPSELFRIVISGKIVNSSTKFKFLHKIFVIQEMFHVFFKLLQRLLSSNLEGALYKSP